MSGLSHTPIIAPKRKKILTSQDYNSKEFASVAFSPQNEKSLLVTLTFPLEVKDDNGVLIGYSGDCKAIIWMWDKGKCFAMTSILYNETTIARQVSFSNVDSNAIIVSGQNLFKFYRL